MSRLWRVPVHDSTRVRDVNASIWEAERPTPTHAGLDPHRTAVAALAATPPATKLLEHADGGRILINLVGPSDGTGPSVQLTATDTGPDIGDIAMGPARRPHHCRRALSTLSTTQPKHDLDGRAEALLVPLLHGSERDDACLLPRHTGRTASSTGAPTNADADPAKHPNNERQRDSVEAARGEGGRREHH
ncbi:hypothetical protein [Streptomyces sp. NPDC088254]|uniref:hypothetical protein n=1 Tax=Streptomyces sp. NPDC088254 TaxID=3365847 RepID=UPI00382E1A0C